ncbi:hypothetical protein BaRGS_00040552 [Batillaria attramentaria]|uniref:LolA-like domain-containing protein n=1 Tax=Batillaria attramentaria TaxID=370345 RepID=A0ABD0IZP3_9CAEN
MLLGLLLSFLLTSAICGVHAVPSYPCPPAPYGGNVQPPADSFPDLPDQFVLHVEANIVQKQATSEAVEVYDFPNKRAAMSITSNNDTVTSIFNYETGERFDLLADGSCKTRNLSDSSFDVFGFTEIKAGGTPTIMKVNDVFRLGQDAQRTFIGETVVRGIPVYHWRTCQTWKVGGEVRAAFLLEYFFSKPTYYTATKLSMVPVRAVINGTAVNVDSEGKTMDGAHNFSHVYEFSFFRPGPVEDDSVFEIPRGTVCKDRQIAKPLPTLPDQFSLSMEVYVAGTPRPPMTERMLFDYDFGLIQTDRYAPRGRGERFGLTKLTIVEDYNNHVQYVIDSFDGNCSISPMPEGLSTSGAGHGTHITMKHGQELLQFNHRKYVYQGQRTLRDLRVDVWANETGGMVQELYFLANWPTSRMRQRLQQVNLDIDLSRA